jgi:hypothetical protein
MKESRVCREDPRYLGLLQHDFADEYAIWIAGVPPGEVAAGAPVPGEHAPTERRRRGQRGVQFPGTEQYARLSAEGLRPSALFIKSTRTGQRPCAERRLR